MTSQSGVDGLLRAVREYFDLMYASDVSRFDRVFRPTAQLHGLRDGKMRMLTGAGLSGDSGDRAVAAVAGSATPGRSAVPRHHVPDAGAGEGARQD